MNLKEFDTKFNAIRKIYDDCYSGKVENKTIGEIIESSRNILDNIHDKLQQENEYIVKQKKSLILECTMEPLDALASKIVFSSF